MTQALELDAVFATLDVPPVDEILKAARNFAADTRAEKVNLGIGMYYDAQGRVPLMQAVAEAGRRVVAEAKPWPYGPALGAQGLCDALAARVFGADRPEMVAAQTVGGTGALAMGAGILARALGPGALGSGTSGRGTSGHAPVVALSTPSWPNHAPIFARAGFGVRSYRYADPQAGTFDREGMLADLAALPTGSVVVLHAGCHNPTGIDPAPEDWSRIADALRARGLIAFVDAAYLGFGHGWEADCAPVRLMARAGVAMLFSVSCSKSFSLYGERVGCLMVLHARGARAEAVAAHAAALARTQYSIPPSHGARIVETILTDPALCDVWASELETMRVRVRDMRVRLAALVRAEGAGGPLAELDAQHGLFSMTGLSAAQVGHLAAMHAIHAVADGRICLAALNDANLERVGRAIASVARGH